jgi:hypothetical protein
MKRGSMPVFVRPWMFAVLVFAFSASSANAVDMPKRKSGLWEIKTTLKGQAGGDRPPVQHCIDEKTDNLMRQSAKDDGSCKTQNFKRSGDRLTMHSVCKFGGTTATSDGVFTGKFDSNYSGDIKTKYDPPMMGMKEAHMVISAKWIGPCKPGMKPGDVIMPGMPAGMPNFNLNDILKQR